MEISKVKALWWVSKAVIEPDFNIKGKSTKEWNGTIL